jgi:hypothetical protein
MKRTWVQFLMNGGERPQAVPLAVPRAQCHVRVPTAGAVNAQRVGWLDALCVVPPDDPDPDPGDLRRVSVSASAVKYQQRHSMADGSASHLGLGWVLVLIQMLALSISLSAFGARHVQWQSVQASDCCSFL